jgi:hypothetical protein
MSDKKPASPVVKPSTPAPTPQPRTAINESYGSAIRNRDTRENSKPPLTAKDATGSTGPKKPS